MSIHRCDGVNVSVPPRGGFSGRWLAWGGPSWGARPVLVEARQNAHHVGRNNALPVEDVRAAHGGMLGWKGVLSTAVQNALQSSLRQR